MQVLATDMRQISGPLNGIQEVVGSNSDWLHQLPYKLRLRSKLPVH